MHGDGTGCGYAEWLSANRLAAHDHLPGCRFVAATSRSHVVVSRERASRKTLARRGVRLQFAGRWSSWSISE